MWDVSGQEKFRSLTNMYFRDTDGTIIVFDVTDRESFENLKNVWVKEVKERAPENVQIAFVGNKADLTGKE